MLESRTPASLLTFPLGRDEGGERVFCDLAKMPHLLMAAKNGADKRSFFHGMLRSFSQGKPEEVQFFLVDSIQREFSPFTESPHLLTPVVYDVEKAISGLNWLVIEMEKRYRLFQEARVRDIFRYNDANPEKLLPRIVVVLAELGELVIPRRNETETVLCRLAQMGRAAGIHLVIATSHPGELVLSGLIKANVPSRLSYAVHTADESRSVLDAKGAENLGVGELLYLPLAAPKPTLVFSDNGKEKEDEAHPR